MDLPDPNKLEAHLEALRAALASCRKLAGEATDDRSRRMFAQRLRSYRNEIRDLEHDLEKLRTGDLKGTRWERRPMDELTYRAFVHQFSQLDEDSDGEAQVYETPGLPLLIPSIPPGLPAGERRRLEVGAWLGIFEKWAEILAKRWRLHDPEIRPLLRDVAESRGASRKTVKRQLAHTGLLLALGSLREPWSGRIGSGEGSGNVPADGGKIVPAGSGVVGQLKWLAQESLNHAEEVLKEQAAPLSRPFGRPDEETDWPVHPESGERVDMPSKEAHPLDSVSATDAARSHDRLGAVYLAARGKESEKLDAVFCHLKAGHDYTQARVLAAQDLGVSPNAIDVTVSRLRRRLPLE